MHLDGTWPDAAELARAATILIYSDGGEKHPALQDDHLAQLGAQMKRGCGFICPHFALEVAKEKGRPEFTDWLGGYFEVDWSIDPRGPANFLELPGHPIRNGVKPSSPRSNWRPKCPPRTETKSPAHQTKNHPLPPASASFLLLNLTDTTGHRCSCPSLPAGAALTLGTRG